MGRSITALTQFPAVRASFSGIKKDELKVGAGFGRTIMTKILPKTLPCGKRGTSKMAKFSGIPRWEEGGPGGTSSVSAMSMKYLGEQFDIHTGGVDNIFPHHENEIAQSEGYTGKKFVNYWLHSEHLLVNDAKMAKRLGNFITVSELREKGVDGKTVRFLLLSGHYRAQLNFTEKSLEQAAASVKRINEFVARLEDALASLPARTGPWRGRSESWSKIPGKTTLQLWKTTSKLRSHSRRFSSLSKKETAFWISELPTPTGCNRCCDFMRRISIRIFGVLYPPEKAPLAFLANSRRG